MDYRRELLNLGIDINTVEYFIQWHKLNPEVWQEFEKVALQAIWDGKKHYGAKSVAEIVRYNLKKKQGESFRLNNNFVSYYARIFAIKHPEHKDFFEFRNVKGVKQGEAA